MVAAMSFVNVRVNNRIVVYVDTSLLCVHRFRRTTDTPQFFVRLATGKAITNPTKELDAFQREFGLPFICSSNARHVVKTMKGNAGLDTTANAGMQPSNVVFFSQFRPIKNLQ